MPATVEIISIPIGSQFVRAIGANNPDDLNDFPVLFLFSENVTGLTEVGITVSMVDVGGRRVSGASVVSLEGSNSVWQAMIRPRDGYDRFNNQAVRTGVLTVTLAENAVAEGNPETSLDIRVSTQFPDVDAEVPTQLFTQASATGIAVSPTRILILRRATTRLFGITKFTHAGVEQTAEAASVSVSSNLSSFMSLDYINGDLLVGSRGRYDADFNIVDSSGVFNKVTHNRLGIIAIDFNANDLFITPYGETTRTLLNLAVSRFVTGSCLAHQGDLLYFASVPNQGDVVAEITDDYEINILRALNIDMGSIDIAIYGDTLYSLNDRYPTAPRYTVTTVDIRKYRPIAKNTKTTIYPQFIDAGGTLDLKQFSPDAERIVFDVGYDKPPFLTINNSNELAVGSGAQTCLVKLKAINRIDATETERFQFYLIVRRVVAPVWRNVSELTMRAGSSYDLFQLVPDAESIAFRSGRTRLDGQPSQQWHVQSGYRRRNRTLYCAERQSERAYCDPN